MLKNECQDMGLCGAIVLQAVDDYRRALDGKSYDKVPPHKTINEVERFFRSNYFRMLTKIDGEYLIYQLRKEHEEKERKKNARRVNTSNTQSH